MEKELVEAMMHEVYGQVEISLEVSSAIEDRINGDVKMSALSVW